ncbi:MAG: hypothetical protein Unbinned8261contig1001_58 [Prokaryotic dsDNA virus sp.]|nr:MAG: hypothetical protein Unbinned8261contig1001_58 [Prokaryotic dsDNA virus sp.]|tara:strand:+ start:6363 stop:7295 length:933 start_codon:yes stop_codon:yes gene_type:complete
MRYLQRIIDQVRRQTENEDVDDFVGIQDSEFIQFLNDAQHHIQGAIIQQHPRAFVKETLISAVSDQERYDLPSDTFLKNKVHNVEYSTTGDDENYYTLEEDTIKRRLSGISGSPSKYIRLSGQILISPQPQSGGKLRINYIQRARELDLRVGKVSEAATISSSTSFTIALDTEFSNTTSLSEHDYICVVDKEGVSVVKNIPISAVTTSAITCDAHTVDSDENETNASILAGHYIVGGKDTTSHGDLPRSVERFLIAYCAWKILKRDSSVDSQEAMIELEAMKSEIVKSYAMISDDIQYIPQLNSWDDWSV